MRVVSRHVVSYSVPISNHNLRRSELYLSRLYLILFLYQTTTVKNSIDFCKQLYLILFLYQTTTTSPSELEIYELYLILFLYQTTTLIMIRRMIMRCILFCSYIKPQHVMETLGVNYVVSYSVPISNHNALMNGFIKEEVVSYSVPISNHNFLSHHALLLIVVSYSVPISNHNLYYNSWLSYEVVSYSVPISNHNSANCKFAPNKVVSYSVPISNHNQLTGMSSPSALYLILFLYQTTTYIKHLMKYFCCILFCSYIKPQLLNLFNL